MQMVRPSAAATWRRVSMRRMWSCGDPCEKFRRATSMPACMSSRNAASVPQEGPMVQMIFALRSEFSGGHKAGLPVEFSVIRMSANIVTERCRSTLDCPDESDWIYVPRRSAGSYSLGPRTAHTQLAPQQRPREQYRIELGADQDYQRDEIHPYQQRNGRAERTVDHAVVGVMLQIKTENHGHDEPQSRGQSRARNDAVPGLGTRHRIVVDERDHRHTG